MARSPKLSRNHLSHLAQYWYRAELMRTYLHNLILKEESEAGGLHRSQRTWELDTYISYWLSALFVLVEGVNKSGLKDARIQSLFNEHLPALKGVRHSTYHFVVKKEPLVRDLNWAEDLHASIGDVIKEHVARGMKTERRIKEAKSRLRRRSGLRKSLFQLAGKEGN